MEIKPGYKQTEIGVIPEDWSIGKLSSSFPLQRGFDLPQSKAKEGCNPVVYSNGILNFHNEAMCKGPGVVTGRSGTLGKVFFIESDYWPHNTTLWVTNFKGNNPKYVFYLLSYLHTEKHGTGSGVPTLNRNDLHDLIVSLPPESEQKLITSVLTDIDSLITSLEKLIEKKKLIKQGAMQELLTGKRRLPGFNGVWMTKRYGDIFQFLSTANYTREDLTDTGSLKYIHYGDIHTKFENYVDLSDASIPTIQDCKLKNYPLLETGDLIMVDASEDYSGVGKSVEVINPNGCKAISGLHTILLRDTSKTFADGYRAFIHSIPSVKAQLDFYATGMKVYSISKGNLAIIEIPVPPKDEQEAIVNAIGSFVDEIKALEVRLAKSTLLKQAMMQELLTGRIRLI